MRTLALAGLLALALPLSAGLLLADDEAPPAPKKPAALSESIDRLIEQLGADDFRVREAASRKLEAAGEAARAALEKAVTESESPEIRWRADQLLRRLRGSGEKPLGAEDGRPGQPHPESGPVPPSDDPFEQLRRWFADFSKRMDQMRDRDPFGTMPRGPLSGPRRIEAPGLVLERVGPGTVQLKVKRKNAAGDEVEEVFDGHSLKDILQRNPDLALLPGMNELKRREAEQSWPGFEEFFKRNLPNMRVEVAPRGPGSFSISTGRGVQIIQTGEGVTVRITEKNEKGEETTKEYKGKSLEQIKRDHPELKGKLGGVGFLPFRVRPPEILWGGRPRQRLKPLPPKVLEPVPAHPVGKALFGLRLTAPDEALASHLKLAAGSGALVVSVVPDSQAAKMGFQRNDIIVKVDGVAVSLDEATLRLRQAGAATSPVTIELIRRGEDLTLSR